MLKTYEELEADNAKLLAKLQRVWPQENRQRAGWVHSVNVGPYSEGHSIDIQRRTDSHFGRDVVTAHVRPGKIAIEMASWSGDCEDTETLIQALQQAVRIAKVVECGRIIERD